MIRNVVLVRLRADHDPQWAAQIRERLAALDHPGTLAYTTGPDVGLREGNWSFAIVSDHEDVAAYQAYDADRTHNQIRADLAPYAEQVARVQFEI